MISDQIRKSISRHFTKQAEIAFVNNVPSPARIAENLHALPDIGLYLHIPFCEKICPYCPYNKEIFSVEASRSYIRAIREEVDVYVPLLDRKPVTSFYIGGGTPTTLLGRGLEEIIEYIYRRFNMQCYVHLESHPNHLTDANLDTIESLGVKYLSAGVEAIQDKYLKILERTYTVADAKKNITRAARRNFECLNIDYIFDLPGQTRKEIEEAGRQMIELEIQQVATYPLFHFDYTRFGKQGDMKRNALLTMFRRRKFLKVLEGIFYDSGFERSSVWAFTKMGIDKYCSVTVPSYLGLGASGSSYLKDIFFVNTFHVGAYVNAMQEKKSAVALSIDLSEEMQMSGWLYWRIYETKFCKSDFQNRFHVLFEKKYGTLINMLKMLGFLENDGDRIVLTGKGAYWIHAFEDYFSIDYINKLWSTAQQNAWPSKVVL